MNAQAETPEALPAPAPVEPTRILRTFRLCDVHGQLVASISLDASIEIDPRPGVSVEQALRRLQKGFRLTFVPIVKGKEAESMYQSDGEGRQEKAPKRMLTEEHKRKMREGRRAAKGGGEGDGEQAGGEDVRQAEIEEAALSLLSVMSQSAWAGKSHIQELMGAPLSDVEWNVAIKWLLETGKIEKKGQKRGSQYRKTA